MMKPTNIIVYVVYFFLAWVFFSCDSKSESGFSGEVTIQGKAQKGPFVTGSDVTVSELRNNLTPTGRIYNATIQDDEGNFMLPDVSLSSEFVEIKVEGYFYDEVTGRVSDRELTITSLASVLDNEITNVNILTHIEDQRVRNLIAEGHSFTEAKSQSFTELATLFGINDLSGISTDDLDLGEDIDAGAFLFAASTIMSSVEPNKDGDSNAFAAWLQFLADFENDFADNGHLDSKQLQDKLVSGAYELQRNVGNIRQNLENTFDQTGSNFEIPDFEPLIDTFLESTGLIDLIEAGVFAFPETTDNGINILSLPNGTLLSPDIQYCIAIIPPPDSIVYSLEVLLFASAGYSGSSETHGGISAESNVWNRKDSYQLRQDNTSRDVIDVPIVFDGFGSLSPRIFYSSVDTTNHKSLYKELYWVDELVNFEGVVDTIHIEETNLNYIEYNRYEFENKTVLIYDNLESVENHIAFYHNRNLIGVSFPVLEKAQFLIIQGNPEILSVHANNLNNLDYNLVIEENYQLSDVNVPLLSSCEGVSIYQNPLLNEINVGGLNYDDNFSSITSISYNVCWYDEGEEICNHD